MNFKLNDSWHLLHCFRFCRRFFIVFYSFQWQVHLFNFWVKTNWIALCINNGVKITIAHCDINRQKYGDTNNRLHFANCTFTCVPKLDSNFLISSRIVALLISFCWTQQKYHIVIFFHKKFRIQLQKWISI